MFQQEWWPPPQSSVAVATSSSATTNDDPPVVSSLSPPPPVHEAIVLTMNVLIQVLQDDYSIQQMNKYNIRPMELVLEAIASIVSQQRYLYGSTTGSTNSTSISMTTIKTRTYSTDSIASTADENTSSSSSLSLSTNHNAIATLLVRLMDSICKMSESTNETLQMAVVTTITTIMTCTKIHIHDNCMLRTIKCTFHIYLVTKSLTMKQFTKRSILDIMRVIFFRMEAHDALHRGSTGNTTSSQPPTTTTTSTPLDHSSMGSTTSDSTTTTAATSTTMNTAASSISEPVPSEESITEPTSRPLHDPPKVTNTSPFPSPFHADAYYLFRSLCKLSGKELPADMTDEQQRKHVPGRLILNALSASMTDPTDLNSKILSLELILIALEQYVGEAFFVVRQPPATSMTSSSTLLSENNNHSDRGTSSSTTGPNNKFIYLVQHYLCGSLLKNCVSNHTQVAYISQKIFFVLVYRFKGHLKQDIEVFMSNVFFRVLESPNSSFKQKALVLVSFRSICQDPNLLTQIFLNYDCDFDAMNLYKDIVHMLTKVGGKATSIQYNNQIMSKRDIEQEFELSLGAIECLVTILKAFLRALNLPAGSSTEDNSTSADIDTAGARIRTMLQLDSALASIQPQQPDDSTVLSSKDSDVDSASGVENETGTNPLPPPITSFPSNSSLLSDKSPTADRVIDSESENVDANGAATSLKMESSNATTIIESNVTNKIVDAFDRKRNAEQNFQIGVVKFTLS